MAKDKFHYEFKQALEDDGWQITDDPLIVKTGSFAVQIDIGADKLIAAEKDNQKIAVEIKTFGNPSFITAFYEAIGQFIVYRNALEIGQIDRMLFLAIPKDIFNRFEHEPLVNKVFLTEKISIIVYNQKNKNIEKWIK